MAKNNLYVQRSEEDILDIDDQRWRKNKAGVSETGENGSLVIDEAVKVDGAHRVGAYLLSGVPVYRELDAESGEYVVRVYQETAAEGVEIVGFLQSINKIKGLDGEYFDRIPVGIQTGGEIYPDWLPVTLEADQIPVRFGTSPL